MKANRSSFFFRMCHVKKQSILTDSLLSQEYISVFFTPNNKNKSSDATWMEQWANTFIHSLQLASTDSHRVGTGGCRSPNRGS